MANTITNPSANTVTNTSAASTVVAAFSNDANAQAAVQELERSGVERGQVHVHSNPNSGNPPSGTYAQHEGGFMGWVKSVFGAQDNDRDYYGETVNSGGTIVAVDVLEDQVNAVSGILNRFDPVNVREEAATAAAGYGGGTAGTSRAGTPQNASVPVIEEELAVGKRSYQRGGVRVVSRVVEEPVEEKVNLRDEEVFVDRQRVDRAATPDELRTGAEQVIEVQEFAEEPVIEKRARVVEEVRVGKKVSERTDTIRETVRHTEVDVEPSSSGVAAGARTDAQSQPYAGPSGDADFRTDYDTNYAASGLPYETYAPGYQYGYSSASDPRFKNRRFEDVESDLRTDYERRNPNSTWEKMKGSIRYGWDKVSGKA